MRECQPDQTKERHGQQRVQAERQEGAIESQRADQQG
jgi:hypothetical protein